MWSAPSNTGEFCIKSHELCIENHGFCINIDESSNTASLIELVLKDLSDHHNVHGGFRSGDQIKHRAVKHENQGSSPQILRPVQSQNRGGRTPKIFAAQALRHRRVCAMVALKAPPMCPLCAPQARPTWWRGSRLTFSAAISHVRVLDVAGCKCCLIGKVLGNGGLH